VQKKLGPAWTDRGRPPAGYFTKRQAEAWLRSVLEGARRGSLPGMLRTGATFADAAAEWLRYIDHDRGRKPSTVAGYKVIVRSQLLLAFGDVPLESITTESIERWIGELGALPRAGPRRWCCYTGSFSELARSGDCR
jgi:integrase